MLVDVHTHLTHEKLYATHDAVIARAVSAGISAMIVNGLEPESNRQILAMAQKYPVVKPALGIYPIEAINHLPLKLPFAVAQFDVDQELAFIESQAQAGTIIALGECGLDGYWVSEETFAAQERVFLCFIEMSLKYELPLIIHTRKLEARAMEILRHHNVKKVDFHCYGGRVNMAKEGAEKDGWYFSIPANARNNEAFTKMLKVLPPERILTETDAPFLPPEKGTVNEPAKVQGTVAYFAELKNISFENASQIIWDNFCRLFAEGAQRKWISNLSSTTPS